MKTVHVFGGGDRVEDLFRIDLPGQGHLDENAVDVIAVVQFVDRGQQVLRENRSRRSQKETGEAEFAARSDLAVHIELRGGIVADQDGSKPRTYSRGRQGGYFTGQLGVNLVANYVAIQDTRGQRSSFAGFWMFEEP